jgi:hypothetical protein
VDPQAEAAQPAVVAHLSVQAPCKRGHRLWGEVVDSNVGLGDYPRVPHVEVRALQPAKATTTTRTGADGLYAFCIMPGTTLYYEAVAPGMTLERHAVTMPNHEVHMDLDLRTRETLERNARSLKRPVLPDVAAVTVELIGRDPAGGQRAEVTPALLPPVVYSRPYVQQWVPVDSDTLQPNASELIIYPAVPPGRLRIRLHGRPGERCTALAGEAMDWQVEAGIVLQVDAVCSPLVGQEVP